MLCTGTYATLGYGRPASIGAKLAAPDRPVLRLVGGGALMFTVQELMTAVALGLDLVVVCADNGGHGEIPQNMTDRGIEPLAVDLRQPDWPALARAFGAVGVEAILQTLRGNVLEACGVRGPSPVRLRIRAAPPRGTTQGTMWSRPARKSRRVRHFSLREQWPRAYGRKVRDRIDAGTDVRRPGENGR